MTTVPVQGFPLVGVGRGMYGAQLRLTRRGRAALSSLCLAVAAVAGVAVARPVVADEPGGPPASTTVVVRPGDTLWDIARAVSPAEDPRETIYRIRQVNGLPGADIRVGDELVVPLR
jgi:nucleoid-associated protein YgaU